MAEAPSLHDTTAPPPDAPSHTYKFNITMTCTGCSGAVERVLKRLDGVRSYYVNLETQTADVITEGDVEYSTVLEKIKKTGKKVNEGWSDGLPETV